MKHRLYGKQRILLILQIRCYEETSSHQLMESRFVVNTETTPGFEYNSVAQHFTQ